MKAEAGKGIQAMRDNAQDLSLAAPERMARMIDIMKQRVATMESSRSRLSLDKPTGRHNSRRLQLEQATLNESR